MFQFFSRRHRGILGLTGPVTNQIVLSDIGSIFPCLHQDILGLTGPVTNQITSHFFHVSFLQFNSNLEIKNKESSEWVDTLLKELLIKRVFYFSGNKGEKERWLSSANARWGRPSDRATVWWGSRGNEAAPNAEQGCTVRNIVPRRYT